MARSLPVRAWNAPYCYLSRSLSKLSLLLTIAMKLRVPANDPATRYRTGYALCSLILLCDSGPSCEATR